MRRFPYGETYVANVGRSLRKVEFAISFRYAILPQSRSSRDSSLPEGAFITSLCFFVFSFSFSVYRLTSFQPRDYRVVFILQKHTLHKDCESVIAVTYFEKGKYLPKIKHIFLGR